MHNIPLELMGVGSNIINGMQWLVTFRWVHSQHGAYIIKFLLNGGGQYPKTISYIEKLRNVTHAISSSGTIQKAFLIWWSYTK